MNDLPFSDVQKGAVRSNIILISQAPDLHHESARFSREILRSS